MNRENYVSFNRLTASEAKQFFILYVGLDCFLKQQKIEKLTRRSFINNEFNIPFADYFSSINTYRLRIVTEEGEKYLLYRNKDRSFLMFSNYDNISSNYLPLSEYQDDLPNDIVKLLIDVAHNRVTKDEGYKELSALLELRKPRDFMYRFIVGAGINYGYGMPDWNSFENRFKAAVDSVLGSGASDNINKATFNTNYGSFQILKDIDESQYENILTHMARSFSKPLLSDYSTLDAISAVLSYQASNVKHQTVLTFNYDELLEVCLGTCYRVPVKSIYKYEKNIFEDTKIIINHSHGFIPSGPFRTSPDYLNSIVLTVDEYFKNYERPSSYGYESLFNQLDNTCCFVGNSITDYEEQKVISSHFNKNPASFHYCYCSSNGIPVEAMMYKTIFLLKIGVIPLWYGNHNDYVDELYKYAGVTKTNNR